MNPPKPRVELQSCKCLVIIDLLVELEQSGSRNREDINASISSGNRLNQTAVTVTVHAPLRISVTLLEGRSQFIQHQRCLW